MSDILNDFSTNALIAAIKANLFEYHAYIGRSPKAEFHEDPALKWVFTGISDSFLNNIFETHLTSGNVDEVIQQTLAGCRFRNITELSWWAEAGTRPADLGEHLLAHGLEFEAGQPGMAADLLDPRQPSTPAGLNIKRVETVAALKDFVHAAAIGYGMPESSESLCFDLFAGLGFAPPLRHYVGYLGGQPVATSELFLGAGVAGIYWVSTVPEARHQGIGSAITQAALQQARELGYRSAILHSSAAGQGVYRQLGFVEHCRMSHYVWMGQCPESP